MVQSTNSKTVQIRLTGSLADVLKAEAELGRVLTVLQRSDFYRNRAGGEFGRLYLTCRTEWPAEAIEEANEHLRSPGTRKGGRRKDEG